MGGPSLLGRLRGDLVYYVLAQVAGTLLTIGTMAVFTRTLDRSAYGVYTIVVSTALMVNEFAFGWLQASALRYWFSRSKEGGEIYDRFLSSYMAMLGLLVAVAALAWPLLRRGLLPDTPSDAAWWGFALLIGQVGMRVAIARTRAVRELRAFFWYSITPHTVTIVAGLLAIHYLGPRASAVLMAAALGPLLVVAVELVRRPGNYVPGRFAADRREIVSLVDYGFPILITSIGSTLLFFSDRFIIASYVGVAAAGLYVLGYTLAFKVDQMSVMLLSGAFPLLVQDYETRPREEVAAALARLTTVFCAIAVPATAGFALVVRPLADLVLGPDFQEAVRFVWPLLPGVFALGLTRYLTKPFQLASKNRPQIFVQIASAIPQLGLNLLLLPRFGPVLAAYTSSLSLITAAAITFFWSKKYLRVRLPWGELAGVGLGTAAMAAAALILSRPFDNSIIVMLVRMVTGIVVYGAIAVALNVVGSRRLARAVLARLAGRRGAA